MSVSRRNFLKMSSVAAVMAGVSTSFVASLRSASASTQVSTSPVYHFLNRTSWGVRPEDFARANTIGVEAYLEEQLAPASIKDKAADGKIKSLKPWSMSLPALLKLKDRESKCYQALVIGAAYRAALTNRQLQERMVEFWSDHFNIASNGLEVELLDYQRSVVRPNALGRFQDLLVATAKHPAMLYYLDNYLNEKDHPNENYARELMELHTIGVDGGYTETDVKEVARAFTGWTVGDYSEGGFNFDDYEHDTGSKQVLGFTLAAGRGIEDGMDVLQILANHPSTAKFLSRKLCVRFVSDDPPQTLLDSTAAVWVQTQGDIKAVLRHIFLSQEFANSTGQKLRRPLEFFVNALRSTGTETKEFWQFENMIEELGQVPYGWATPDGYPDVAAAWMNTNGLLSRWNKSTTLTERALWKQDSRLKTQILKRIGKPTTVGQLVDAVALQVFGTLLPDDARAEFVDFASDGGGAGTPVTTDLMTAKLGSLFGLMLSSPLNQWR